MSNASFSIHLASSEDAPAWSTLRAALWPDGSPLEHMREIGELLAQPERYVAFLARSSSNRALGFAEAAVRQDYVNGCETSRVLFLEGIYVLATVRGQGIARALCAAIARWGTARGCLEFASDAQADNTGSHAFHRALGFEETERVVYFRKRLHD